MSAPVESMPAEGEASPAPARSRDAFPWGFFLFAIGALVSGHLLAADLRQRLYEGWPWLKANTWLMTFVLLPAALTYSARRIFWDRLRHELRVVDALVVVLAGNWVSLDLHEYWHHLPLPAVWSLAILGAAFLGTAVGAHFLRKVLETFKSLERTPTVERVAKKPIKGLVILVSPPTWVPDVDSPGDGWAARIEPEEGKESPAKSAGSKLPPVELPKDLAMAIEALNRLPRPHNWQQILRAIQPLCDRLEHVWLVGSKGNPPPDAVKPHRQARPADGSAVYLDVCRKLLRHFLPAAVTIHAYAPDDAVDFEDFKALKEYLMERAPAPIKRLHAHELAVDITGGIKIASVAGAVLTLNDESVIQYVQTGANGKMEPFIYDLRRDNAPELH